jgi:hypothetical protein
LRVGAFDDYAAALTGPSVISAVLIWEPHLRRTYDAYVTSRALPAPAPAPEPHCTSEQPADGVVPGAPPRVFSLSGRLRAPPATAIVLRSVSGLSAALAAESSASALLVACTGVWPLSFLKLLSDRQLLPAALSPSDVEEVFRRVFFSVPGAATFIRPLTYEVGR